MNRDEYYAALERNTLELAHYGKKGQIWGKRLYQNKDGSLTPLGYIHYGYKKRYGTTEEIKDAKKHFSTSKAANTRKKKVKEADKVKKQQEHKEQLEKDRAAKDEREVKNGNLKYVYKHRDRYTDEQIKEAMNRSSIIDGLKPQHVSKIKNVVSVLSDVTTGAKQVKDLYETGKAFVKLVKEKDPTYLRTSAGALVRKVENFYEVNEKGEKGKLVGRRTYSSKDGTEIIDTIGDPKTKQDNGNNKNNGKSNNKNQNPAQQISSGLTQAINGAVNLMTSKKSAPTSSSNSSSGMTEKQRSRAAQLLKEGKDPASIAKSMNISEETVKEMQKAMVNNS